MSAVSDLVSSGSSRPVVAEIREQGCCAIASAPGALARSLSPYIVAEESCLHFYASNRYRERMISVLTIERSK